MNGKSLQVKCFYITGNISIQERNLLLLQHSFVSSSSQYSSNLQIEVSDRLKIHSSQRVYAPEISRPYRL